MARTHHHGQLYLDGQQMGSAKRALPANNPDRTCARAAAPENGPRRAKQTVVASSARRPVLSTTSLRSANCALTVDQGTIKGLVAKTALPAFFPIPIWISRANPPCSPAVNWAISSLTQVGSARRATRPAHSATVEISATAAALARSRTRARAHHQRTQPTPVK